MNCLRLLLVLTVGCSLSSPVDPELDGGFDGGPVVLDAPYDTAFDVDPLDPPADGGDDAPPEMTERGCYDGEVELLHHPASSRSYMQPHAVVGHDGGWIVVYSILEIGYAVITNGAGEIAHVQELNIYPDRVRPFVVGDDILLFGTSSVQRLQVRRTPEGKELIVFPQLATGETQPQSVVATTNGFRLVSWSPGTIEGLGLAEVTIPADPEAPLELSAVSLNTLNQELREISRDELRTGRTWLFAPDSSHLAVVDLGPAGLGGSEWRHTRFRISDGQELSLLADDRFDNGPEAIVFADSTHVLGEVDAEGVARFSLEDGSAGEPVDGPVMSFAQVGTHEAFAHEGELVLRRSGSAMDPVPVAGYALLGTGVRASTGNSAFAAVIKHFDDPSVHWLTLRCIENEAR